jgi:hypothetical protein
MLSYQFFDNKTNEPETLSKIDGDICVYFNEPVDDKCYHPLFHVLVECGLSILIQEGGSFVDEAKFNKWCEKFMSKPRNKETNIEDLKPFLKHFLFEEFTYKAWR